MSRSTLLVSLSAIALLSACTGGGPTPSTSSSPLPSAPATATPTASTSTSAIVTPTVSPTALPSPTEVISPEQWAAEMCDLNAAYQQARVDAFTQFPLPDPPELVATQAAWAGHLGIYEPALTAALSRFDALQQLPGAEPFHAALREEFQTQLDDAPAFFGGVEDATTVEEIGGLMAIHNASLLATALNTSRAVAQLDPALVAALAAVTTDCRGLEFDARGVPTDEPTEEFSEVVIDDSFDANTTFSEGAFEDGSEVTIEDGELSVSFVIGQGTHYVLTDSHPQPTYHDARIEANIRNGAFGLAGLICRSDGNVGYAAVLNPVGMVFIYRLGDQQPLLGRAIAPEGFDASIGYHLALECVRGGDLPLLIAVYLNDVRIAEVLDSDPLTTEGYAGMFSRWLADGSATVFQDFKVTVKP